MHKPFDASKPGELLTPQPDSPHRLPIVAQARACGRCTTVKDLTAAILCRWRFGVSLADPAQPLEPHRASFMHTPVRRSRQTLGADGMSPCSPSSRQQVASHKSRLLHCQAALRNCLGSAEGVTAARGAQTRNGTLSLPVRAPSRE